MLLGYLDESYIRGEHYWLGATLVPAETAAQLNRSIRQVVGAIPADLKIPLDVELKGYDLFHRVRDFRALKDFPDLVTRLYRKGLTAIVEADVDFTFVGVSWAAKGSRLGLDDHRMAAVRHLLPALEARCEDLGQHFLLIADEEETTRDRFEDVVREHQWQCREQTGDCRLLDNVLFVTSHDSSGVQAADLATFIHQRRESGRDKDPRAIKAVEKLWEILSSRPVSSACHAAPASAP